MTKLSHHILFLIIVFSFLTIHNTITDKNMYQSIIKDVDRDSSLLKNELGLQTSFASQIEAQQYIGQLPALLHAKGYVTASVDSIRIDSSSASLVLFLGKIYRWALIDASCVDPAVLNGTGWREKNFSDKAIDFNEVETWQKQMLDWLENNGQTFGKVYLASLEFLNDDKWSAVLKVNEGPLYKIDSARIFGETKISNNFLQRYLEIPNGSIYNKKKLMNVSKKIRELSYVEEEKSSDITMLATGSILNVYLKPKRSSQVNILFGILPNSDQNNKVLITGE